MRFPDSCSRHTTLPCGVMNAESRVSLPFALAVLSVLLIPVAVLLLLVPLLLRRHGTQVRAAANGPRLAAKPFHCSPCSCGATLQIDSEGLQSQCHERCANSSAAEATAQKQGSLTGRSYPLFSGVLCLKLSFSVTLPFAFQLPLSPLLEICHMSLKKLLPLSSLNLQAWAIAYGSDKRQEPKQPVLVQPVGERSSSWALLAAAVSAGIRD